MRAVIAVIINLIVAYLVNRKKQLDFKAILLAYVFGVIVIMKSYFAYIMLGVYFFIIQVLEKKVNKVENRTALQVFSNGIMAILALMFERKRSDKAFLIFICLLASSLADCIASDIGTIYASKVYSIVTLKQIQKGISGGISIVGCCASVASAVLFSAIYSICSYFAFATISVQSFCYIIFWGVTGMLLDSILGAIFQKRYYCNRYNILCEDSKKCKHKINIQKYKVLSNNGVNLVTSIILFLILEIVL